MKISENPVKINFLFSFDIYNTNKSDDDSIMTGSLLSSIGCASTTLSSIKALDLPKFSSSKTIEKNNSSYRSNYIRTFVKNINISINKKNLTLIPEQGDIVLLNTGLKKFSNIECIGDYVYFDGAHKYIDADEDEITMYKKYYINIYPDFIKKYTDKGILEEYKDGVTDSIIRKMSIDDIIKIYNQTVYEAVYFYSL